jgi:hypothetical protein
MQSTKPSGYALLIFILGDEDHVQETLFERRVSCLRPYHFAASHLSHSAIAAAKQTLLGLPRMRELINLAKQLKTPALTVYLNAPYNKVWILARKIQKLQI